MTTATAHDARIAGLRYAKVYPMYLAKVRRKGRTQEELDTVIRWLTGLDQAALDVLSQADATFATLFAQASPPAEAERITGVICGVRVEEIANPLTRDIRRLDKVVDELAKGRPLQKVMRRG
ncbi:hypothetical protein SAMN05444339_101709 [Loktanella atrilutea]|uniref:DUF2200 domain-containing protein n=1 Tax=Loktanella atrilutea TaxID=366533 RepID=A0A1M4UFU5_LOKAT|nr:DUF2200 domain-containing protein [Loktanella atrilutea]SHE55565.1 hypothetical protein SAMN05444339_101709 [Loktanella atrilutea]